MRILKRTTELLPCELTGSEFDLLAKALAESIESHRAECDLQAQTKADMKAKLLELERQRDELARIVARRREERLVEIELRSDDARGVAYFVRLDTGEIYGERALRSEERQASIFDESPAPTPSAAPITPPRSHRKPGSEPVN